MISNGPNRSRQEESQETTSRSYRDQETRLYAPSPYTKDGSVRGKPRGRYPGEFRTFRSSVGRGTNSGSYRSRPPFSPNTDRDPETRRYRRDSYSKRYYPEPEDSKITPDSDRSFLLEDPRISKLVRRLISEPDLDKALNICAKLMDAIVSPENSRYVKRAYETVAEALLETMKESVWTQVKTGAAAALGRLGSALSPDCDRHLDWINVRLSSRIDDQVKGLLLSSFASMFSYAIDDDRYDLTDFVPVIMSTLQEIIEATDSPQIFTAGAETLISLAESHPEQFCDRFTDTVDILIGWHVDSMQTKRVKDFAVASLERLSYHWCADLAFSVKLMAQFLEDMSSLDDELDAPADDAESPKECVHRIASFVQVFNAVAKSLGLSFNPVNSSQVTQQFLHESCEKLMTTCLHGLKTVYDDELAIAGCESGYLFLEALKSKISGSVNVIYELISFLSENYEDMNDDAMISFLDLIRKTVKEVSGNLPASFVTDTVGEHSTVPKLIMTNNAGIRERVIAVYHSLLNLKNIPLLQDVYKYVLRDLESAYSLLLPDLEPFSNSPVKGSKYSTKDADFVTLLLLQCLSDIANARNSIIGMWALQPSILELLAVKLQPHHPKLSLEYPAVQFSILCLLYSHCKNNNHFISSSDLVTFGQQRSNVCDIFGIASLNIGETPISSPTSTHFSVILTLFNRLFESKMSSESLELSLKWIGDIFIQLEKYKPTVYHSPFLKTVVINTIKAGFTFNIKVVSIIAKNLQSLVSNRTILWNYSIMKMLCDLCFLHIDNNDSEIAQKYTSLLTCIPWDLVILDMLQARQQKGKKTNYSGLSAFDIKNIQKEHLLKGHDYGQMMPHHFKMLMGFLLFSLKDDTDWLNDCFICCWPLQNDTSTDYNLTFFKKCAKNLSSALTMWATWEAAQLCTATKLRTPLGKPQDTFTSIESVINKQAKYLTSPKQREESEESSLIQLKRNRMLVEFFEFLEKSMFNAAEGCTSMITPVIKTVKTFFHTNNMTCKEWVNRVRPAALSVALHSGHAASVVRHSHSLLISQTLKNSQKTFTSELLGFCLTFAKAFIHLKEPEALLGLYTWIKKIYDTKLQWIKAASEEASMRYESAIFHYMILVHKCAENNSEPDDNFMRPLEDMEKIFILEQITQCYSKMHFWSDLLLWKEEEKEFYEHSTEDQMLEWLCYNKYQEDEIIFPEELCNWNLLTENENTSNSNWSSHYILQKCETNLKNVAMKLLYQNEYIDDSENIISEQVDFIQTFLQELSRNQPNELLTELHILHFAANGLKRVITDKKTTLNPFLISPERTSLKNVEPSILNKVFWWSDYFCKISLSEDYSSFIECLRLDVIKSNRKHGNYSLAKKELVHYFTNFKQFQMYTGLPITQIENIYNIIVLSPNVDLDIWSLYNVIAVMEATKILYSNEESKHMAIDLCASASLGVSQRLTLGEHPYELKEKGTRMLLTLSKWVQNADETLLTENINSPLTKLVTALPEIGLVNNNVSANVIPILDSSVGKLLQFSVNQCPGLAKAWFNFGSWCFRWGRKMVEYSANTGGQLTENDKHQIQSVMLHSSPEDFESVCEILSKIRAACDDEDIDWNEISTSEMIESQLRSIPSLRNVYPEHIVLLVDIWRQAQKRVFSYYELSADAYFKFLELSSTSETLNHNGECCIIIATLRLLRLIVKHAMELQNVLESGLSNTPTQPWKVIIPQLFSRLNHPENYVRRRVSELLCRLAEDAPHLITFPAVVGAVENEKINLTDINFPKSSFFHPKHTEFDNDYELNEDNSGEKDDDLNSCFMDMVETLSKQAPETILQVQLLVKELRRINLLWDELWLGTLAQQHSKITHTISVLTDEISEVKTNSNLQQEEKEKLISRKHTIIMKPIIYIMEQLAEITSAIPETPHEQYFQDKYLIPMHEMLDKLKNPSDPSNAKETWSAIHQFQTLLHQRQKKVNSLLLKMSDISPILAKMTNTVISMPGVQTSHNIRITIKSIENTVSILPSKTKPKKLVFNGSNGKVYTYLFKGLEDLHLDERIMQFLSITNTMLAQDKENNSNQTYSARHYSVIPLGPKSGLISWVDNLTPLFTLYKKWQERERSTAMLKNINAKPMTVFRPSELYYNKLTPLLQAAGISLENRKQWPANILKQVLTELLSETPNDLLAKELWCNSVTPGQWWQTVRRYSFSVAVMSIIGYVIGLGDRHLHNILVDLSTGEVVHIDYNVCFEKGKTLRVPEKVPFRLTANMENALGVTGVEGIFRLASEHVLKVAKRGRETLLTLLEAFVYDPLVEWGGGTGGGVSTTVIAPGSKSGALVQIECSCAIDMLAVKVAEVRHDWNENRDEILSQLPAVTKHATTWVEHLKSLTTAEARLQHNHRQIALIKELEALGSDISEHPLVASAERFAAYKEMKDAINDSAKNLSDLFEECKLKLETYSHALETVKGPQLGQWIQELNFPIEHDGHLVFSLIREFLMNAGQSSMITQCEQSETELSQIARHQTALIKACVELLSQYAAVIQYYPQSFMEKHKTIMFQKWSGMLLETHSPDMCRDIIAQVQAYLATEKNTSAQQAFSFTYPIQTAEMKLGKFCERLQNEGGQDALSRAEKNLVDAKAAITAFISQDSGADKAVECFTISTMCALNRRYLILETGAHSAGECLVDLTSREGDWFFDDMNISSSLISELISFIPSRHANSNLNDDRIPQALEFIKAAKSIFSDLQDLSHNFQMIILPEAIKKIQCEDPSVLMMINELNNIIVNIPIPLNELSAQLEMHLRYIIMDMESPSGSVQSLIANLRVRFEALVNHNVTNGTLHNAGQMLIMGFNGLFAPLTSRGILLIDALVGLCVPHVWKKVDQINEAKDLAGPLHSEVLRSILEDIIFIKRIQAISEFFGLVVQMSCGFKGVGIGAVYDDERLCKPIRKFIADYIARQFLGIHSQCVSITICLLLQRLGINVTDEIEQRDIGVAWKVSLEELCEISVANAVKNGLFTASILQQASALVTNFDSTFRRREAIKILERNVHLQGACVSRLRLQATAHSWLKGETKPPVADLRRISNQLINIQPKLVAALEKHRALVASAEQRLKWAAGANPALNEIMAAFECAVNIREDRLNVERTLSIAVCNISNALASGGGLENRSQPFKDIMNLASKRRLALSLAAKAPPPPIALHESLLQMLRPEGTIDSLWVNNVSALLSDMIGQLQKNIVELKNNLSAAEEHLKLSITKLTSLKNAHESLVDYPKFFLKLIIKLSPENMYSKVEEFLAMEENYQNNFNKLTDGASAENLKDEDVIQWIDLIKFLEDETPSVYAEFMSFGGQWYNEENAVGKRRGTLVRQVAGIWSSPARQTPPRGRGQQQNAYATSVWKRVRLKLEGRDPDQSRKITNQEQVDYIINEAMSIDNLCLLYEGWTPWV